MPLYEYECESGEHRFERIQKFSDPPVDTCPTCGRKVRKLLSSPAIQFKGSGWYITDYAKKSSSDGGSAGSAGTTGEKKTDTKTDSSTKSDTSTPSSTGSSGTTKSDT